MKNLLRRIKQAAFQALMSSRFYPNVFLVPTPFKIYEFRSLRRMTRIRATDVILDVGCGSGMLTHVLGRDARKVVGIDVSKNDIDRALSEQHLVRGRIDSEFRLTTIKDAGFADRSFDKVFSICVLEHIEDRPAMLSECRRVLKDDGELLLSVDSLATVADEAVRRRHREQFKVLTYFTPDTLRQALEHAGFADIEIRTMLSSPWAARLFAAGLARNWIYRYSEAALLWMLLHLREAFCADRSKGIYLLARCRRPSGENAT